MKKTKSPALTVITMFAPEVLSDEQLNQLGANTQCKVERLSHGARIDGRIERRMIADAIGTAAFHIADDETLKAWGFV